MRDLKLTGVDGADVHLVDDDGDKYRLVVDDRVHESVAAAAVAGSSGHVVPHSADAASSSAPHEPAVPDVPAAAAPIADLPHLPPGELVTPRTVQELLRAGHSAQQVATAAGWDLAKVERYAAPIEAERRYIAGLAQDLPVETTAGDAATTIGERVAARLHDRGVAGDTVVWDAHRTAGRGWIVVCRFSAGGRTREASWQFRAPTRTLTAVDDEARWLGEDERAASGPVPVPAPPVQVFDVEAEGGVTEPVDLVSAMQARSRGRRGRSRATRASRPAVDAASAEAISAGQETSEATDGPSAGDGDQQSVPQQPGHTDHEADRTSTIELPTPPTVDDLGHDPVTGTVDLFGAVASEPEKTEDRSAGPDDASDTEGSRAPDDVPLAAPDGPESVHTGQPFDPGAADEKSATSGGSTGEPRTAAARDQEPQPASDLPANPADDAPAGGSTNDTAVSTAEDVQGEQGEATGDASGPASEPGETSADEPAEETVTGVGGQSPVPPRRPGSSRSGRPSVPSWDDIMFGGRRGRD